jgi:hypothetical protein
MQLRKDCIPLRFDVYGLPMDGGIFPVIVRNATVKPIEYSPNLIPLRLAKYLEEYAAENG